MGLSPRELELLEIVLRFYDGFAEGNETNSQLQGEAARAYRKVAALYRVLGREQEAEQAHARALGRFESLVRRHGEDSEYGYELARTLALDGPDAHAVSPERAEPDLRRAIAMVERLFERAPERKRITYAAALARWNGWLAEHLESLGRPEEAVNSYRASIVRDEWLADQLSNPPMSPRRPGVPSGETRRGVDPDRAQGRGAGDRRSDRGRRARPCRRRRPSRPGVGRNGRHRRRVARRVLSRAG